MRPPGFIKPFYTAAPWGIYSKYVCYIIVKSYAFSRLLSADVQFMAKHFHYQRLKCSWSIYWWTGFRSFKAPKVISLKYLSLIMVIIGP